MRYLFIGYSILSLKIIKILLHRHHEVMLLERDTERVRQLKGTLDCELFLGDASKAGVLEELYDPQIEMVFCLSNDDHYNILTSFNAQTNGFKSVITLVEDSDYEPLCAELGLHNLFLPSQIMSEHLAEFAEGGDSLDLQSLVKYDARLFSFIAQKEDELPVFDIPVPDKSRIICVYRDNIYLWPDTDLHIIEGDEVVMITHTRHLETLRKRWIKRQH